MSHPLKAGKDKMYLLTLVSVAVIIYYPLFYTEYAYTDELTGLWQWNTGKYDSTGTLLQYGRYITARLAGWLFGSIDTIKQLSWLRLFSFGGWLLCLPVWYFIFKRILKKEDLPGVLSFWSLLYLICMPPFTISVSWAACFEMFIANTAGLMSGYLLYEGIKYESNRVAVSSRYFTGSVLTGLISLFTYQNCFGFFLLPFLLHLIAKSKITRTLFIGVTVYFFIALVYFLLFRYSLKANHMNATDRTSIHINVVNKLLFFLGRPLNTAFHFTGLFSEKSIAGLLIYGLFGGLWFVSSFAQKKRVVLSDRIKYFLTVFALLGLIYLPSLVIKENYASNRTLFALNLAVFFLCADTLLNTIKSLKARNIVIVFIFGLFAVNAWYNFNYQYLLPVKQEYQSIRKLVESSYHPGVDTVYFIRPPEDFFVRKYGITRSWDEFGVPSTFFEWSPEFLIKQIVFEKTGDRGRAEKLTVKNWLGKDEYEKSGLIETDRILLVDTEALMKNAE